MQITPEVTFRQMAPSSAVEARIQEHLTRLDRFHNRIMSCRVVVEAPHRQHRKGNLYNVSVDITLPGSKEILANREKRLSHAHQDIYVALRDAFNATRRQLQDTGRKQRGKVKSHETPLHGTVARVFTYEGYGFVETPIEGEIYFDRHAVVDGAFEDLEPGSEVRLVVAEGESDKGLQATTVRAIGKHHLIE